MNLKTTVEHFKIPFVLSLSKGGRDFEMLNNMSESVETIHASTRSARTVSMRLNCGI